MTIKMLKFSVPTNWQDDLIPRLDKEKIEELYGQFASDITGGGRASANSPMVSRDFFESHLAEVHRNKLKFNYLLNATCLDNREWSASWQKKFRRFIEYLIKAGVDKVTVAIPYLMEIIKKRYPSLKTCVSVQAGVDSLGQVRLWEDLGADEITLFMDINRNFSLLKEIRKHASCKLKLIANLACLYNCPFQSYHSNLQSHASQAWHSTKGFAIDYCTLRCRLIRLRRPEEFIRSRWIRPEDSNLYEDMGIDSLKFVNRNMKTNYIVLITSAYTKNEYKGNLLDLFSDPSKSIETTLRHKIKYFFRPLRVNIFRLYKANKLHVKDEIYIDNTKLNGFLKYFFDNDCTKQSCEECNYCKKIADEIICIPQPFKDSLEAQYKNLYDNLINGEEFTYF